MVFILDDDPFEGLDVIYGEIWPQICVWVDELSVGFEIEMKGGVECDELEPDGVVFLDGVWLGVELLIESPFGEGLVPVEGVWRCSGQNIVPEIEDMLRSGNGGPG
ncbi:hypothetical protein BGZ54_009798 [Gamsiella multidivaricata]|nr:hypothetical protein BGZ54_009798 [Gamsiella multidivaricata]